MSERDDPAEDDKIFLSCAPGLAFILDQGGRIHDLNAQWEPTLGFPADALRGKPFTELAHPEDRTAIEEAVGRLRDGEAAPACEARFLRRHPGHRRLVWSAAPRGQRGLAYGVAHDVTATHRRLRQFESLASSTTDFIGLADLTGKIQYVSPAGMAMIGRDGEDFRRWPVGSFRTPQGEAHFAEVIRPSVVRDGIWSGESEFQHVDGSLILTSQVMYLIHDEDGRPEGFATIVRDLTEQKRAEGELRKFEALVEATSDFVGIARISTGRMEYVNPAGMALMGRKGEAFEGLSIQDVHRGDAEKQLAKEALPALKARGIWSGETQISRKDGELVPVSMVLMQLEGGEEPDKVAAIARDLTELRRAEALSAAIRVMAAPLLQVWDGVLAMPIIGLVDSARAAEATEALLEAINRTSCQVAILDLTGVESVDTSTVEHLFRMVSGASLLGSRCVISGVSAAVAQTVTQLGLDVSKLETFRTLREALRFALRLRSTGETPQAK